MKTFWKVLGAAALAAGLVPYRVKQDEETGETRYQALLWQATRTPQKEGEKDLLDINIGFKKHQEEEPHLFSDEICVEYMGTPVTEEAEPEKTPETPAQPESPAEPAPQAAPAEEKEEA